MKFTVAGCLMAFMLQLSLYIVGVECKVDKNFVQQLSDLRNQGVTEDEIKKWWFRTQAKNREFPRIFPFCYDPKAKEGGLPSSVKGAYKGMEPWNLPTPRADFDPQEHGWLGRAKTHFKDMKVNRISIQRLQLSSAFNGEEGKVPFKLQQWADFAVTFNKPIKYFYAQAIGGPLGTPVGEFTLNFGCTAGDPDPPNYQNGLHLAPCHFAPRNAITWPNVFVADKNKNPLATLRFRFKWTETQCHETAFFQFIMIAIDGGNTPNTILSPIFRYKKLDTPSAVASPYHPYYDKIQCGLPGDPYNDNIEMLGNTGLRIIPNKDYDECVTDGKNRGTTDIDKDTCPPGPFNCDTYWTDDKDWKTQMDDWWKKTVKDPQDECCEVNFPLPPPTATTTTTTTTTTKPTTTTKTTTTKPTTTTTTTTTKPSTTTKTTTTKPTTTTTTTKPTTTTKTTTTKPTTTTTTTTTKPTTTTTTTTTKPTTTKTTTTTPSTTTKTTSTPSTTMTTTFPSNTTITNGPSTEATTSTTTESPLKVQQKEQEKYLNLRTKQFELKHKITHGDFCVLVWLVMIPIADNIGRFFKDFSEFKSLGLGFWIIMHAALHSLGLIVVWWSLGLVLGGGDDRLGNVSAQHFFPGLMALLLQHLQFITGLKRSSEAERKTFNFVMFHSLCGYCSHFAAYISLLMSTAGVVRKWISLGLFLMWVIGTIAFFLLERQQDKRLGVVLHRAQCPILQRIVIDGPPPMGKMKIVTLSILVFGQLSLYIYMLIAHSAEKTAASVISEGGGPLSNS